MYVEVYIVGYNHHAAPSNIYLYIAYIYTNIYNNATPYLMDKDVWCVHKHNLLPTSM